MGTKRPLPDAVQAIFATAGLVAHILTYLDVTDLVRVQSVSKTFDQAAAQPATWAHTVWQPTPDFKSSLPHLLRHSLRHLHTLILTHHFWHANDFNVRPLAGLRSVELTDTDEARDVRIELATLTDLLEDIGIHHVQLTHIDVNPDGYRAVPDALLKALVSITTLQKVELSLAWHVDGKQIDTYIPQLAARGCEVSLVLPNKSEYDHMSGLRAEALFVAALRNAHHLSTLYLSHVDVETYQAFVNWRHFVPSEQLPDAAISQLKHFKLELIDVELDEAIDLELLDEDSKNFDCNYNDWMHVFLSQHLNIQTVEVESPFYKWTMTDALRSQLTSMQRLKRLRIPSCNMSDEQRQVLQPLLVDT